MSAGLTEELARVASKLSPEATDAMKRLGSAIDDVIDELVALENIKVYGRDRAILAEHLANLHRLRHLRQEFEGRGRATGPGSSD